MITEEKEGAREGPQRLEPLLPALLIDGLFLNDSSSFSEIYTTTFPTYQTINRQIYRLIL